jgi:O-antigen ligase
VTPDATAAASAATAVSAPVADLSDAAVLPPRTELWKAAVAAWRDHPVLGLGPDNFRLVYGRYLGLEKADERLHANSLYFETLASLGLLGVAALAFLIVAFWRLARRTSFGADPASAAGWLAPGLVAGLAAFLVHGLFDYFLEFTPTYGLAWLLAGMLVAVDNPERSRESNRE